MILCKVYTYPLRGVFLLVSLSLKRGPRKPWDSNARRKPSSPQPFMLVWRKSTSIGSHT